MVQVTSIPALFMLYNGDIVGQRVGMMADEDIADMVKGLEVRGDSGSK